MSQTQPHPEGFLGELTALYRRMLRHAEAGSWDAVLELEGRRGELAAVLAASPPAANQRTLLAELARLNEALERQVVAGRGNTLSALGQVRDGRRMRRAYGDAARAGTP